MAKESHNYDHSHNHANISTANIKLTFFLNSMFTVVEVIVGLYTNSVTISSSAIHDFGDSIILFFSLLLEKKSKKGRTNKYTYGYRRFSLLGKIINITILLLGGIFIFYNATIRLFNPEEVREFIMLFFSLFGIAVNGYGASRLYNQEKGINQALFLNIISDFFAWIAIFVSALAAIVFKIYFLDALFSIFLGLWLSYQGLSGIRDVLHLLMQAVPRDIDIAVIRKIILQNEIISQVHDLHVWDLDGEDYIASFHIVSSSSDLEQMMAVKEEIKLKLELLGINHATIEIDTIEQAQINGEFYL